VIKERRDVAIDRRGAPRLAQRRRKRHAPGRPALPVDVASTCVARLNDVRINGKFLGGRPLRGPRREGPSRDVVRWPEPIRPFASPPTRIDIRLARRRRIDLARVAVAPPAGVNDHAAKSSPAEGNAEKLIDRHDRLLPHALLPWTLVAMTATRQRQSPVYSPLRSGKNICAAWICTPDGGVPVGRPSHEGHGALRATRPRRPKSTSWQRRPRR
jgi:hypothetical protein